MSLSVSSLSAVLVPHGNYRHNIVQYRDVYKAVVVVAGCRSWSCKSVCGRRKGRK